MLLITGFSNKLDGICFLADTDDPAEARQMCCDKWNETFTDQVKLMNGTDDLGETVYCLVSEEVDELRLDGDAPRREGWTLFEHPITVGEIMQRMPW